MKNSFPERTYEIVWPIVMNFRGEMIIKDNASEYTLLCKDGFELRFLLPTNYNEDVSTTGSINRQAMHNIESLFIYGNDGSVNRIGKAVIVEHI